MSIKLKSRVKLEVSATEMCANLSEARGTEFMKERIEFPSAAKGSKMFDRRRVLKEAVLLKRTNSIKTLKKHGICLFRRSQMIEQGFMWIY